nr:hypothetical protein [uncultured Mucilaginibacter sp.]
MTHANNLAVQPGQSSPLVKRMLIGAGIGAVIIALFILPVKHPQAEWGQLWMLKPFIITPFSGAVGGLVAHFMMHFRNQYGWNKVLTLLLTAIICVIGLWMGIVLGLNGTLWN